MAEKWSRNIKLDAEEDKDVIDAAERMGPTLLFRQAVRYYLAREPYAIYPEKATPRHKEEAPAADPTVIAHSNGGHGTKAKLQEF